MTPILAGLIVIACTFGGALAGRWLRRALPDEHLGGESRDTIKLGFGLIATMSALVLGLVTASAKTSFDSMDQAVRQASLDILVLDRLLARYGPETTEIRQSLKQTVAERVEIIWPDRSPRHLQVAPGTHQRNVERMVDNIEALAPRDDRQRSLKARAADLAERLLQVRWLQASAVLSSIPVLFLVVLLGWITLTFVCYGMLAPPNLTVAAALLLCAVSVGSAVFLILEMDGPFDGFLRVSPAQLLYAIENMGR
jgi:hypothetical protein